MIIWLASYPKSGNTWVRLFLSAYCTGAVDINNIHAADLDDLNPYFFNAVSPTPVPELTLAEMYALKPAVLTHICHMRGHPVFVKTHSKVGFLNEFPIIPAAMTDRAVYIVRDPRDVAVSFAHHLNKPVDAAIESMGQHSGLERGPGRSHVLGTWSQNVETWLDASFPVHLVKYEALLADTENAFAGILEFLEWELDDDRFNLAVGGTSFDRLRAQEEADGFREFPKDENGETPNRFFREGRAGQWKGVLTPDQIVRIEDDHGEVMERLGYETRFTKAERGAA